MSASELLFLGFDLSTQQLKAILITADSLSVVHEASVHYDTDLPSYGTSNGAILGPDKGRVTSPVRMWLDALDLILERIRAADIDLGRVIGIGGAGQQHGSVYWSLDAPSLLASLDPTKKLGSLGHLAPQAFSLPDAPIWQDSSTTVECRELEEIVGGPQALSDLTGSRAYERFTGVQIARIRKMNPSAYAQTVRISLVSSFLPSLFLQRFAPIEVSDASGMNLMNILTSRWEDSLLEACGGPELRAKLGPEPALGGSTLGKIGTWWVQRWGFNPDCVIAPFAGDNPATVVPLSSPGDAVLSLGTSTTLLFSIPPAISTATPPIPPKRTTTSHLLAHPTVPGGYIAMLCYKNGALARERVRDRYASNVDDNTNTDASTKWARFNELVRDTPSGNDGYLGFYFPQLEIIPPDILGQYFFKADSSATNMTAIPEPAFPSSSHPRAILESQLLSIKLRVVDILPSSAPPPQRLVLVGGSSSNPVIQQVVADVFGTSAYVAPETGTKEAAALGGALLARYAWWGDSRGGRGTFEGMMREVRQDGHYANEDGQMMLGAVPDADAVRVYEDLVNVYASCEKQAIADFQTTLS
ncbi:hypothetical protein J3A83DRAFT_4098910 [Scleroderma citrinum]